MLKKTLATALLVFSIPAIANAWFFSTQVKSAGGSIDTPNKIGQVVTDGAINKSYLQSDVADKNVTVTANAGFTIKSVTIGGVTTTAPASPFTVVYPGSATDKSVSALFAANAYTASASIAGGSVTPTSVGNLFHGYTLKRALVFTFAPSAGSNIDTLTGVPAGATADAVPAAVNARVKVTFPVGYTFTAPVALAATTANTTPTLNAILPQVVATGAAVTVQATVSNIASPVYTWAFVSGPVTPTFSATADTLTFTAPATAGQYVFSVKVPGQNAVNATVKVAANRDICSACHTANNVPDAAGAVAIQTNYAGSVHSQSDHSACYACHAGTATGAHPGTLSANSVDAATFRVTADAGVSGVAKGDVFCTTCHKTTPFGDFKIPHSTTLKVGATCVQCHTSTTGVAGTGDAHAIKELGCVDCHSVGQTNPFSDKTLVDDNNGVRAITTEFGKWSHHVTGVTLNDAHCAACHLEGKASNGAIVVDGSMHMKDNLVHLRNADTDEEFGWDPATPDHSVMDNFCMSCHDANGASSTGSAAIQAVINAIPAGPGRSGTASALNPFGDTISNQYDQLSRGAVVAVKEQFDGGNSSHHAVRQARYGTRNLSVAQFSNISSANAANGTFVNTSKNTVATATAANQVIINATIGTLYETSKMSSYVPFDASVAVGDDSRLHCADCHTVGQWKPNTTNIVNPNGTLGAAVATVIGAHGSNNEYMLRNANGTDSYTETRGSTTVQPQLVCFICHAANQYDGATANTNAHNGAVSHSVNKTPVFSGSGCNGPPNNTQGVKADVFNHSTSARLKVSFVKLPGGTYGGATGGNIFGNQCSNCHNSSDNKLFGGIHGNAARVGATTTVNLNVGYKTYSSPSATSATGLQNVDRKPYRFLPGLGNFRYNGGVDSNAWTRKAMGTAGKSDRMGCYTLNGSKAATNLTKADAWTDQTVTGLSDNGVLGSWGGCTDHASSPTTKVDHAPTRTSLRPLSY